MMNHNKFKLQGQILQNKLHPSDKKQQNSSDSKRTKVVLLVGFLGAGKTTVMKSLLEQGDMVSPLKTGVIINEFGKINVDGETIRKDGLLITEINNGSIFCKCLEGSFVDHILALQERSLDYLFIESSGLADPSNMGSIMNHVNKRSGNAFEYAGILCVVDAKYFMKLSRSLLTIKRQVAISNLIVVNKTDLVDPETLSSVIREIVEINPLAEIITTQYGKLPSDFYSSFVSGELPRSEISLNTPNNRPDVILLRSDAVMPDSFVRDLLNFFQGKIIRLKGFIQYNAGFRHVEVVGDEYREEPSASGRSVSELVIIPFPGMEIKKELAEYLLLHPLLECVIK